MAQNKRSGRAHDPVFVEKEGIFGLTSQMLTLTANRLEDALSSPQNSSVVALKEELGSGLRAALSSAPEEVVSAVQSENYASSYRKAYLLGQVGMAHTLASRSVARRGSEEFESTLTSDAFRSYLLALIEAPLTNTELASVTGERLETVSRKLKKLRNLGATDFRREGQLVQNFLTPPARAIAEVQSRSKSPLPQPKVALGGYLLEKISNIETHMHEHQNFSTELAATALAD